MVAGAEAEFTFGRQSFPDTASCIPVLPYTGIARQFIENVAEFCRFGNANNERIGNSRLICRLTGIFD
jgi:hypothetical protein